MDKRQLEGLVEEVLTSIFTSISRAEEEYLINGVSDFANNHLSVSQRETLKGEINES